MPPSAAAAILPLPNRSPATRARLGVGGSGSTPHWADAAHMHNALSTVPSSAAPTSTSVFVGAITGTGAGGGGGGGASVASSVHSGGAVSVAFSGSNASGGAGGTGGTGGTGSTPHKTVPGAPSAAALAGREQAEAAAAQVKEAATHAEQVAALLAAQAQEQREREREDAEALLNASLVGSGTRQKLQGLVGHARIHEFIMTSKLHSML